MRLGALVASSMLGMALASPLSNRDSSLHALIYNGTQACSGCAEAIGDLLDTAFPGIDVAYAAASGVNSASLSQVDMFAYPGGDSLDDAWNEAKAFADDVRNFVSGGGHYLGFCLGAYLAGPTSGFNLLPSGVSVVEEINQANAQVMDESDSVIQVDWTFSTGAKKGSTEDNRWLFFQDGAAMVGGDGKSALTVLGYYSKNRDVAATTNAYGQGKVALVGPHPEADETWYSESNTNPEGVRNDIGIDFVRTAML